MIIEYLNERIKMPDFFVVGAPKAGTTSLYDLMKGIKGVFLPKIKEPQYFAYKGKREFYRFDGEGNESLKYKVVANFNEYKALFAEANDDDIIGDFSTHYLRFSTEFIANIKEVYGESSKRIKIVILLRDPIQRAYSHYMMRIRDGSESLGFADAIAIAGNRIEEGFFPTYDYLRFSQYSQDLEGLKRSFPQVCISTFERIIESPSYIKQILTFLDLTVSDDRLNLRKLNISGMPSKSLVSQAIFDGVFGRNAVKKYLIPKQIRKRFGPGIKSGIGKHLLKKQKMTDIEEKQVAEFLREEYLKLEGYYTYPL